MLRKASAIRVLLSFRLTHLEIRRAASSFRAFTAVPQSCHRSSSPLYDESSRVVCWSFGRGFPELSGDLGPHRLSVLGRIGVVLIDSGEDVGRLLHAHPVREGCHVHVVTRLVALHDPVRLDPERLFDGRHADRPARREADLLELDGAGADQLTNADLDVAAAAEDDLARDSPIEDEVRVCFQRVQDSVEPVPSGRLAPSSPHSPCSTSSSATRSPTCPASSGPSSSPPSPSRSSSMG